MPTFKQTPASISYRKARLNFLKRPTVWATACGLLLSVFLVGEYLANPQQYTGGNNPDTATNPSNQNPSGNLPTQNTPASSSELFEALPDSTASTPIGSDPQPPESDNSKSPLLQEFLLGRSSIAAQKDKLGRSQSSSFSTSTSAENKRDRSSGSRFPGLSSSSSPSSGFPSSTLPGLSGGRSGGSSLTGSSPINPLQSALDRYSPNGSPSNGSPSQLSPSASSVDNSPRDSRLSPTVGSFRQNSLGQQESTSPGLPSPQFSSQVSPLPGTTGYTLPPTLRTSTPSVSPSSSYGNFQPIPGQTTPQTAPAVPGQSYGYGQTSSPNAGQTAYPGAQPSFVPSSQPMPSPFSAPRAVPGRSIGGGQINTFSNP